MPFLLVGFRVLGWREGLRDMSLSYCVLNEEGRRTCSFCGVDLGGGVGEAVGGTHVAVVLCFEEREKTDM